MGPVIFSTGRSRCPPLKIRLVPHSSLHNVLQHGLPAEAPKVKFDLIDGKPLFHPNVYRDGGVCLSIINPENSTHGYGKGGDWEPTLTIKHVMEALQVFLDEATGLAAGRNEEYQLWKNDRAEFNRRVKLQVAKCEEQPSGP